MPIHNVTIDDGSPIITYDPQDDWIDSDPSHANPSQFFGDSFHASQKCGASAAFTFNGTGVYIYGAQGQDRGPYSVAINGEVICKAHTCQGRDKPMGQDEASVLLFSKSDLQYGLHKVILTNTGRKSQFLDLDYVDITTGDGDSNTVLQEQTLNAADKAFTYDKNWEPYNFAANKTKHATNKPHAQANITFHGNAIRIHSTSGRKHGLFSVSLDGGPNVTYNASAPESRQATLLYSLDGLPDGDHLLTVENLSEDVKHWFALENVTVSSYIASGPSNSSMPLSGTSGGADRSLHTAVIVGAVIGSLVGLCLLFTLIWVIWRRGCKWKRRNRFHKFDIDSETGGTNQAIGNLESSQTHDVPQSYYENAPTETSSYGSHLDGTATNTTPLPALPLVLASYDLPPSYDHDAGTSPTSLRTTVLGGGKGKELVLTYKTE